MNAFAVVAIVLTLSAALSFLNYRVLRLHPTIGMMLCGLLVAAGFGGCHFIHPSITTQVTDWVTALNFNELVMNGMLGFLLFAGATQINMAELLQRKWPIGAFALGGVVISAFATGGIFFALSDLFGLGLRFMDCLLFGALISPTDPIAVLSILKQVGAPKDMEMDISGESMFNDGIGVVMFIVVARMMTGGDVSVARVLGLFGIEALGGLGMGVALGFLAVWLMRSAKGSPRVQVLLTLAVASGGYQLAQMCHMSGPLAMIVSGVMVGSHLGQLGRESRTELTTFWEVIDEVGNAILFMLVGLELLVVMREMQSELWKCALAGALAIPTCLIARWISLVGPWAGLRRKFPFRKHTLKIMTWGGLRGGLPFAMALLIPHRTDQMQEYHVGIQMTVDRAMLLTMTYCVVAFSIFVQGLTIKGMVARSLREESEKAAAKNPPA